MTRELTVALVVTCRGGSYEEARAHATALVAGWAAYKQARPGEWPQAEEFVAHAPDGVEITMQAAWVNGSEDPA